MVTLIGSKPKKLVTTYKSYEVHPATGQVLFPDEGSKGFPIWALVDEDV
jgi:hypothetical protein